MATGTLAKTGRRTNSGALAKYDPQKGVKQIAVAEMAAKHYSKVHDVEKARLAVRDQLEKISEFVLWWDTHVEKNKGAAQKRSSRSGMALTAGKDGIPDSKTIHRWRRRLNDPDAFEKTFEAVWAKTHRLITLDLADRNLQASLSNEWYTPAKYVDAARLVLGVIDLDPASCDKANETIQAETFYTHHDDGLSKSWAGRVWLNPPYGGMSGPFAQKLIESFSVGDVTGAVLLVNSNSTDTDWFQPLWNYLLCFTDHRINFVSTAGEENGSTHGSVFVYFGQDRQAFMRAFAEFGVIVEKAHG